MARIDSYPWVAFIAPDYCDYELEITDYEPKVAKDLYISIEDVSEKMKVGGINNLTIAIFETGPKGYVSGELQESTNLDDMQFAILTPQEKHIICCGKHFTRVDIVPGNELIELKIYKRIKLVPMIDGPNFENYITKIYHATRMQVVDIIKAMARIGITSEHIWKIFKEESKNLP